MLTANLPLPSTTTTAIIINANATTITTITTTVYSINGYSISLVIFYLDIAIDTSGIKRKLLTKVQTSDHLHKTTTPTTMSTTTSKNSFVHLYQRPGCSPRRDAPGVGVLGDQLLQGGEGRGLLPHRQAGRQLATVHSSHQHHADVQPRHRHHLAGRGRDLLHLRS